MQLTELLFQKVKDLPGQGQLALKPGYVAVVSRAASLRVALVAALCPSPDDQRRLAGDTGPARIGVGLLGADGAPYRLLRELGGSRQLQKLDPATRKFATLTEDALEIDSFLRVECGMPHPDAYTGFFVLEVNDLPSLRTKSAAASSEAYVDQDKVRALRAELEVTKKFEAMQDRLFKVQQRLHELNTLAGKVAQAEGDLAAVDGELGRAPWSDEEVRDLTARATGAKEALRQRDEAVGEVARRRQKAAQTVPQPPEPFLRDPWFGGGLALGLALDALAFVLRRPSIALLGLLPFGAALIAVLRYIHDDEADKEAGSYVAELKERDAELRRDFDAEAAPLKAALRAADADTPDELLELFKARELVGKRRETARARLEQLQLEPELSRLPIELPLLETEKTKLEDEVHAMGFSRAIGEIENDLRHALGLADRTKGGPGVSEAEVPKLLLDRSAELLAVSVDELWTQVTPRLSAYLTALTDKRVTTARPDDNGLVTVGAADGRTGPFLSLPPPLRDLAWVALRLALLEKVAGYKRLPVIIDDSFGGLDAPKRALIGKMLKGISTQTQILHRVAEAPPAGTADAVLAA